MSFADRTIHRAIAWMERETARSDAGLLHRSSWWHIGKIAFGALLVMRSVYITLHAEVLGRYALAGLFLLGGAYLVYDGVTVLKARRTKPNMTGS